MGRKFTDAIDHPIAQPESLEMPAAGDIDFDEVRESVIEPVTDMANFSTHAEALRFNEDMLTIMIHEGVEQTNPEPYVMLSVNGRGAMPGGNPWVPRGVPVTIARKYVERLCLAKPVTMRTVEAVMPDGSKGIEIKRNSTLQYPFSVMEDPAGQKGFQWLREKMAQRA
jgi:hypothetical protein